MHHANHASGEIFHSDDPHGLEECPQGPENGNADGDSEHAKGEPPLLFVPVIQLVPQTFNGSDNLVETLVYLFKPLIYIASKIFQVVLKIIDLPLHMVEPGFEVFGCGDDLRHQHIHGLPVQSQAGFLFVARHEK